uniref:4-diphosphocytidyl-2-C-methyl-D-erythritol kinase, chloroplastic n=1 Tax=Mentha piperita TaxID=34256 RepID=ISPE_MENPI|nr:RecName: Full=4-diphosphocytidyl-2-C-methyl-D-erythritol kinase, chloroplastic; AltName: Full=4-(cytidine-5'-diphospho)-2-C-methyl-D-erythritol kinase; Short=CMK; Flags: Precursor [Mentha x piperita]AAF13866.1 isopentenyl monophosphate kinase [Mentha x piperita]CAB65292.1 isopentenyl monophosphate kinase [Mentha x piperita]
MASSSHFLYSHHHSYASYNSKSHFNSFTNATFPQFSSFKPNGSSSFRKKLQSSRIHIIRAAASDPTTGRNQLEVVYDLENKLNKLADEVDREAGISRLTLFSPCKINVFLRITGKREDGFHDLASLFHVISLGDKIKFSLSPSKFNGSFVTNVPGVPLDEKNLIIKALNLFRKKTGTDKHFWIHLDKKVPTGAGLGGGSSNAATALWAANQFSGCIATEKDLQEWSGEIGSDIPFFFSHGAAYCTGRGEVVEDIPPPVPRDLSMVLMKPQEACPTGEVYKRLRLDQTSDIDPLVLLEKISKGGISQDVCVNDLEPPAFEVVPSLKRLKQRIAAAGRSQYDAVFMSGSGSTIVGVGSPDPPQFVYDGDEYKNIFFSEAKFITRSANQWYSEPLSTDESPSFPQDAE